LKNFVFDNENINVDALEAYLNANKEELLEKEDEINIDIRSMTVKGDMSAIINSTVASTASEVSSNAQSSQAQSAANNS
jgi:hypothetical protein